ncbi:MAG: hypothetical protein ABR571_07020 [Jatrophihabitans sp.]|uniref:hypothetical protein n=1 Tax=Jatrophihabitans sp. TaxID=1932789 RepID=UPI0039156A74
MKLFALFLAGLTIARERLRDERGDVPGWVMVTVMTAILVVAILGVFEPQIKSSLSGIIDSVSGKK